MHVLLKFAIFRAFAACVRPTISGASCFGGMNFSLKRAEIMNFLKFARGCVLDLTWSIKMRRCSFSPLFRCALELLQGFSCRVLSQWVFSSVNILGWRVKLDVTLCFLCAHVLFLSNHNLADGDYVEQTLKDTKLTRTQWEKVPRVFCTGLNWRLVKTAIEQCGVADAAVLLDGSSW